MRTRTTFVMFSLLLGLAAACGGEEPLPTMPEPAAPADESSGGDLDSLGEEAPAEEAPADE